MNFIKGSDLPDLFSKNVNLDEVRAKPYLPIYNVCFIGHVDAGKSTTVARILYDTGRVDPHVIDQFEKEAKAINKQSFKFAWLMDRTKQERIRGITIDLAHAEWSTPHRYYTIIDAPGHTDFIKNMITGTSQADLAVLLVDCKKGVTREGDDEPSGKVRPVTSTEEHLFLTRSCGITSLVVALNKVNMIPLESRMQIIKERIQEVTEIALRCGFALKNIIFVPVNSWDGWNISEPKPDQLPGYEGPTLIEALDTIPLDQPDPKLPFRLSIESVFSKIGGTNLVVAGKVLSGMLVPGDQVSVKPAGVVGTVRSIQMHHKPLSYATQGANVGIDLKGVTIDQCTKASVLSLSSNPAKSVESFTLENAIIKSHPTQLSVGSSVIVHYLTGNVCCEITRMWNCRNVNTKKIEPGEVTTVLPGSVVNMELVPEKPIVVEPKHIHPKTSRVMLRDCNMTIGFGVVDSVKYSKFEL